MLGSDKKLNAVEKHGRYGPYLVCDRTTVTVDRIIRAIDAGVWRSSSSSFASALVDLFRESVMPLFFGPVGKIAAQCDENLPDTKLRLAYVKHGYLGQVYIPTVEDV